MDPKIKNLLIFVLKMLFGLVPGVFIFTKVLHESDPLRIFAYIVLAVAACRVTLCFYRRVLLPGKHPLKYGKWAIVTGIKQIFPLSPTSHYCMLLLLLFIRFYLRYRQGVYRLSVQIEDECVSGLPH